MLLLLISFIAGVLTALAPCVLPLLPVIVGGSISGGTKRRPYVITTSLGVSVILFTLLLKASTAFINVPQSAWQWFSAGILIVFGIVMVFPKLWDNLGFVGVMNRSGNKLLATGYQRNSFWGDALMGAALGPVFSSCSPTYFVILATVLPASFFVGLADLIAYAIGLSGFLFLIAIAGQRLVDKLGVAIEPGGWFRRTIGALFILVGIMVGTGAATASEAWLLSHGFDISFIEQRLLGARESSVPPAPEYSLDTSVTADMTNTSTSTSAQATAASFLTLAQKALRYQKAPELTGIDGYINTPRSSSGQAEPITIGQFKGNKVVLIDIWTYTCINCQRTLPYLKEWYDKYADQGLEIIGVHTPEFAFEHVLGNVQAAVTGFGLKYPVVLDNEYATWNAFNNVYWPRKYLIDIDGYIVYDHAGEGSYDEAEKAIQKALAERAARFGADMPKDATSTAPTGVVSVDQSSLGSPETYFGASRNEYLGNGTQGQLGDQTFTIPASLKPNTLYLGGSWTLSQEYATNKAAGAKIQFLYKAKNVYFVAAAPNGPVKIKVTRDGGQSLGNVRGKDVDANGETTISGDKLYQLVGDTAYGIHTLEIEVESTGLQAYTFTFG